MAVAALTLFSCEKDDNGFVLNPGEAVSVQLETSLYTSQIYYSLSAGRVVATVPNDAWDLQVQTHGSDSVVMLNSGLPLMVVKTNSTNINDAIELGESPNWAIDPSSGDASAGVFAHWKNNEVYVVGVKDLSNQNPAMQPVSAKYKVAFAKTASGITVKWADLTQETVTVKEAQLAQTSQDKPFTWFSFGSGGKASVQPPSKESWDIVFSPYTTIVQAGPSKYFYNVKGTRTNRFAGTLSYRYAVAGGETNEFYTDLFNNLNSDSIKAESFKPNADVLGYNWKKTTGDVTTGSTSYVIDNTNMFFIKDHDGRHFKFRFASFYNTTGQEGYAGFEYVWLKE